MVKNGDLRPDRKASLLEIGFVFDRHEDAWNQSFEELRLFKSGALIDPEREDLQKWCKWCDTQMQSEKRGRLRADRKARLQQIGFVFDVREDA